MFLYFLQTFSSLFLNLFTLSSLNQAYRHFISFYFNRTILSFSPKPSHTFIHTQYTVHTFMHTIHSTHLHTRYFLPHFPSKPSTLLSQTTQPFSPKPSNQFHYSLLNHPTGSFIPTRSPNHPTLLTRTPKPYSPKPSHPSHPNHYSFSPITSHPSIPALPTFQTYSSLLT